MFIYNYHTIGINNFKDTNFTLLNIFIFFSNLPFPSFFLSLFLSPLDGNGVQFSFYDFLIHLYLSFLSNYNSLFLASVTWRSLALIISISSSSSIFSASHNPFNKHTWTLPFFNLVFSNSLLLLTLPLILAKLFPFSLLYTLFLVCTFHPLLILLLHPSSFLNGYPPVSISSS